MRAFKVAAATVGMSAALVGFAAGPASAAPDNCVGGYPAAQCTVAIDDSRVVPGETVAFTADGFAGGETVIGTVYSTPVRVGTYTANSAGVVSGTFVVPAVRPGRHTFQLQGVTSGVIKSVSFVVVPNERAAGSSAGSSSDDDSLAFTGSDTAKTAGAGAVLLLGGGALIVAAKRRKSASAAA